MATPRSYDCYVYVQLPKSLEVVTCGHFVQEQRGQAALVGRFIYSRRYREREDAVPIDPVNLPLTSEEKVVAGESAIFGALRDAAPDAWGRRIIERALQRTDLSEVEYLLESPDDRAGALSFGRDQFPPAPVRPYNRIVQLQELYDAARELEADRGGVALPPKVAALASLLVPGTSMGGARPKNVVEDDQGLWLAKFPARDDRWNNAPVEAGLLNLAKRCGIRVPVTRIERLGEHHILLVSRFDREPAADAAGKYLRHRMVSALTVLDASESAVERRHWSYPLFADELRRWSSRSVRDQRELFRRMVFNALVSNSDDHPRNHALVAPGASFELAPAYDITPTRHFGQLERDLALEVGAHGRAATRANALSMAPRFSLSAVEADGIIDAMVLTVRAEWEAELKRAGATQQDIDTVRSAILNEGFEYGTLPA